MPNITLYSSDQYFVNAGLTLPQNVFGTLNTLDTISKYNGIHFVPIGYNSYNPFFYFKIDTNGGTGIDVSVAIRRVSDNAYMTEILKTGVTTSTEIQPTTSVPEEGSQMYGVRFKNYLNGGLQPNTLYRFSIRLDRPDQSILSATNSYTFQISTSLGGITLENQQSGQIIFVASYMNNLIEYCRSWSSSVTGTRNTVSQSLGDLSVTRGDLISISSSTSVHNLFTKLSSGFVSVTNYVKALSDSGTLQGWQSQYTGNEVYNYSNFIDNDIATDKFVTSSPIIGDGSSTNFGILGNIRFL